MATQTVVPADGVVSFVVPAGVTTLTVDAVGGAGGAYTGRTAGKGGRVKCDITVTPGETLSVRAGAAGASGSGGSAGGGVGDGLGGGSSAGSPPSHGAAGGGGSSGVRRSSTMLVVGPGGGGSGRGASGGAGGDGGTPSGSAGGSGTSPTTGGGGGTSSAGGAAGTKSSSGYFNAAGVRPATQQATSGGGSGSGFNDDGPGGGGGGYYGGGAGGGGSGAGKTGGGGGGSSYIARLTRASTTAGYQSLDGYCILTFTPNNKAWSYRAEVLRDGPLAFWMLDDPSGTTVIDASENYSRSITYTGSPTLAQASIIPTTADTCVSFDGTDDYATITSQTWMNVASITVEAVVNLPLSGYEGIVSRDDGSNRCWVMRHDGTGLYWSVRNTSDTLVEVGPVTLTANTTAHIACTYASGSTAKVYVNGVEVASAAVSGDLRQQPGSLRIGRFSTSGNYLTGKVQGVAVHGSALSADRIMAHARAAGLA